MRLSLFPDGRIEYKPGQAVCNSSRALTSLEWLGEDRLIIGRFGNITIWHTRGSHSLDIPMEEFRGWTSLPNPIDIVNLPASTALIAAMSDGTLRRIDAADSAAPRLRTLYERKSSDAASLSLCEDIRRSFMTLEKTGSRKKTNAPITSTAAMSLSGLIQLDLSGTIVWVYERHQLDRRVYTMPNVRKTKFAIARLQTAELEEGLVTAVTTALTVAAERGKWRAALPFY